MIFKKRNPHASRFEVTLYGSLASTGKGHLTDVAIEEVFGKENLKINWKGNVFLPQHPNGILFESFSPDNTLLDHWTTFSIGGGDISDTGMRAPREKIYPHTTMLDILSWCKDNGTSFWEYVERYEDKDIYDFLADVWRVMKEAVERGIANEGVLPGGLCLTRKAASFFIKGKGHQGSMQRRAMTFAYALAVAEENASGGVIVTAPTCGSCGVIPATIYHLATSRNFTRIRILRALATAGLFGNVVKTNSSISGAEVGCQGEIGVACAMAAAAACQLFGGTPSQIEYAAEMGLEHHLGLTCDPVCGLVQVPCIERNAIAAARALDANTYATLSDGQHLVAFDKVVAVMKETGLDMPSLYRETSEGGLAKRYHE